MNKNMNEGKKSIKYSSPVYQTFYILFTNINLNVDHHPGAPFTNKD